MRGGIQKLGKGLRLLFVAGVCGFRLGFPAPWGGRSRHFFGGLAVQVFFIELFWVWFCFGVSGSGSRVLGCWVFGVSG